MMSEKIKSIESYRDLEDNFKSQGHGKATFKVKQVDFAETAEATTTQTKGK